MPNLQVGKTYTVKEFCFSNQSGGTEMISNDFESAIPPIGAVEVKILRSWHDYECGYRAVAEPVSKKLIDFLKEHEAKENIVYISEFDLSE